MLHYKSRCKLNRGTSKLYYSIYSACMKLHSHWRLMRSKRFDRTCRIFACEGTDNYDPTVPTAEDFFYLIFLFYLFLTLGAEWSILFHRRSISDYVISKGAPNMMALTACFWVKRNQTDQGKGEAHYISYVVYTDDNEFLIKGQNQLIASINYPKSK